MYADAGQPQRRFFAQTRDRPDLADLVRFCRISEGWRLKVQTTMRQRWGLGPGSEGLPHELLEDIAGWTPACNLLEKPPAPAL